jgi:flagellar basal body-associated protein FliL
MSIKVQTESDRLRTWLIILMIVVFILTYGLIVFFTIGDKGPPSWDFGAVKDVPGESLYSTHTNKTDYLKK